MEDLVKHTQLEWKSSDGITFFGQVWEPDTAPRAVVALVHGLGEHSGRYAHVASVLSQAGYALMAFDLRGHGRSTGQRGYAPSYERLMQDIDQFLAEVDKRFPGQPRFLYGHSLGGDLVLNYVLRRRPPLAGVVATGSALRSPLEEQTFKVTMARLLNGLLPALTMHSGLPAEALSRDAQVVRAYVNDPLVHDLATPRLAVEEFAAGHWALEHAAEFPPIPLLLMHGSADRICYPEGTCEFAGKVSGDCTLEVWEGCYHEIHNEPEKVEVLGYMVDWLNKHLPA
jgi:alpha-beta hydrolase superfamily lysophospholipase